MLFARVKHNELKGQLEDKEKAVMSLRQQVEDLATRSTQTSLDNSKFLEQTSNAATQTDKVIYTKLSSNRIILLTKTATDSSSFWSVLSSGWKQLNIEVSY